jgi:hydroxypyruvate isomerase
MNSVELNFELAVCAEMLFRERSFIDRVTHLHELGFAIDFWDWTNKDLQALADTGANFSNMTGYISGTLADPEGADEMLRTAALAIEAAQRISCTRLNLHGTGLNPHGLPTAPATDVTGRMWLTALRTLERIAVLGAQHNVVFCLENLNTEVTHPGVPFARLADVIALVEAVDSPNLRITLDIYHAQIGEGNLIELIRQAGPLIDEVQVSDVPGRFEPGTGEINYPAVARALAEIGYTGMVGLECLPSKDSESAVHSFRELFSGPSSFPPLPG